MNRVFPFLFLLGSLTCFGQRNKMAPQVITPPVVPMVHATWTPNPKAMQTVLVSSTNLFAPKPWTFRGAYFNSLTNEAYFPRTNNAEFFDAYSE